MMIEALYIITFRGDILLKERYTKSIAEDEINIVVTTCCKKDTDIVMPVHTKNAVGYAIRREKMTYLAICKNGLSSVVVIQFLESFYALIRNFCGGATEDHIAKNLLLVFELMTECVDNGFLKTSLTEQVRHTVYSDPLITRHSQNLEIRKPGPFGMEKVFAPNSASEKPLVKSRSEQALSLNEVFVDIIERVTAHFDKEGHIEHFYLLGVLQLKSFISHNHKILVSLENSLQKDPSKAGIHFDEYNFDGSVQTENFNKDQSFSISPTQDEIKALTYSTLNPVLLPFRLTANIQEANDKSVHKSDCDLTVSLTCNLPSEAFALNISLHIPISSVTRSVSKQFSQGENSAEFLTKEKKILWKIKKMHGQEEVVAKFKLIDALQVAANRQELGPISLEFEASNTACSGLGVRNLKAEAPSGKPLIINKWVRYATLAQSYAFRI